MTDRPRADVGYVPLAKRLHVYCAILNAREGWSAAHPCVRLLREAADALSQEHARAEKAETDLRAAQDHARKHIPSIERIREAHIAMPAKAMEEWSAGPDKPGWGHRVYTQGQDEACYLCALVIHAERAEARAEQLERLLSEADEVIDWLKGGVYPTREQEEKIMKASFASADRFAASRASPKQKE